MIQIRLHDKQYKVAVNPSRFRVVCAGRRFGKSVLSRSIVLDWASKIKNGLFWIVSPTYQMGKDIHWKQGLNIEIPSSWIAKKNEADFEITLVNGSRIALRSAENPDRLRGVRLNGLIVDECAFIQRWDEVWKNALRPSLSDTQAPALFISTPQGYNHFYDLYLLGQKKEKDWRSWKFTTYDNPFIPKEEIEKAKRELDEDAFAQEYLAEFKKFTGLVVKDFKRETHVIEPTEFPQDATYYRSIDFGFVNPTAVIFAYINNKGELIVYDEIYQKGLQTPDLANLILQKSAGRLFSGTYADSSQASDIAELQKYGIDVLPVSKSSGSQEDWVVYKIRKLVEKVKQNKLKITKNCVNLIWEIENYRYHEVNKNGVIREIPMKVNDHLIDALTYLITSLPEEIEVKILNKPEENWIRELPDDKLFNKDGFF